jgi:hypothetical protein
MSLYYGVAAGDGLVDVSDSSRLVAAVASGETVGLGAAVSIFRSQATSNAAPTKVQMYFFIDLNRFLRRQSVVSQMEECPITGKPSMLLHLLVGLLGIRSGFESTNFVCPSALRRPLPRRYDSR